MVKLVLKLTAAFLCIFASGVSYGLASICSGEYLPLTGKNTLKHEAVWSYHDNWFSDMYAEVFTEVQGTKTTERSDEYLMGNGGSTLHYLESPANGDYDIKGYIQTGYPQAWGFDGYFGVECPLWSGSIENAVSDDANEDTAAAGELAMASKTAALALCSSTVTTQCAVAGSSYLALEAADARTQAAKVDDTVQPLPATSITGIIQAVDKNALILITDSGQYVPLALPAQPVISRHTDVNLEQLAPDSVVGVVWGNSTKNEREVVLFRHYRNVSKESVLTTEGAIDTELPGLELRGVLKTIVKGANGSSMRLTHAKGEASMAVSKDAFVTIIDTASFSDLAPFARRVRAVAQRQEDGSLLVSTIEILH